MENRLNASDITKGNADARLPLRSVYKLVEASWKRDACRRALLMNIQQIYKGIRDIADPVLCPRGFSAFGAMYHKRKSDELYHFIHFEVSKDRATCRITHYPRWNGMRLFFLSGFTPCLI